MNQLIEQLTESGIRSEFLHQPNYKATLEFAQKRHQYYLKYCSLLKSYYHDFQISTKFIGERIKILPNDQLDSIKQFKQHLIEFVRSVEEIATFKIQYYQQLEETEVDPIRGPTNELIYRVGKYAQAQNKFAQIYDNWKSNSSNLTNLYIQVKKDVKNPVLYFDQKYVKPRVVQIQGLMKGKEQIEAEGNSQLQLIYKNRSQFESDIVNYRQRLISSKYKAHKKIIEMSKGARQCLTQTLITMFELIFQREKAFQGLLKQSIRESTLLVKYKRKGNLKIEENTDRLTEIIINATQEYNDMIQSVEGVIKNLVEGLPKLSENSKEKIENAKIITEQLNKLYDNDQNPTPQILDTLDLFNYFCQKIGEIPNMLHLQHANLLKLKQNINKHSQITLSLLKCSIYKGVETNNHGASKNMEQLNNLFDQLSYDYINDIMEKVIRQIEERLSQLKNYFNAKYHKKKKNRIDDSMDISHIEEQQPSPHKRPSKQQIWIWKQFKNYEKYRKIKGNKQQNSQINKFIQPFLQMKIDSQKEVQKFNCSLNQKKQVKGILKILQKNIIFSSSNNEIDINIPIEYVCEVVAKIKTFEKELSVVTSMGQINFGHFPQISKAQVLMQQQMNSNVSSKPTNKKITVEVTPEELAFIADRKPKIQSELQSTQGYEQKSSIVIQNTTIDTVYDLIYSDKPFKFKGKEQNCFFAYALKKSKASNFSSTKYEPSGPKFYSLQDGRTFINCPLFSTRSCEYELPLPPVPFMPKSCINNESIKLFWTSNEQFDYLIRSQTKGAPYAQTFFINLLHKIVKKDKNVQIKIFYKLNFVQDCMMKGVITSKSAEEVKLKSDIFLAEAAKIVKTLGGSGQDKKDGTKQQAPQEKETEKSMRESPQMKKLQNQNKILIGVLVGIIIINLLLRLF